MQIHPLCPSDMAALYALYLSLTALMPYSLPVGEEQFARELTVTRFQEDEWWAGDAHLALVAEREGRPAAFLHASFLERDARYGRQKAGAGMIRFLFCAPREADALRLLVRAAVGAARARACHDLQALAGHGPLFHDCGASGLSNAWPWVGRALVQEGFETIGRPALSMYCPLDRAPLARLPLPPEAILRSDWVTRVGRRDHTEGGYHIFLGGERAAESMWHFGEKYVTGAGRAHAHLFWLGTNEPYRGLGLGRVLLRETLARVQEEGALGSSLRCNIDNFYAHALYRTEGYEPNDLLWCFRLSADRLSPPI